MHTSDVSIQYFHSVLYCPMNSIICLLLRFKNDYVSQHLVNILRKLQETWAFIVFDLWSSLVYAWGIYYSPYFRLTKSETELRFRDRTRLVSSGVFLNAPEESFNAISGEKRK